MGIREKLGRKDWSGQIEFTIEDRAEDCVVASMPIQPGIVNSFGTVHAGAMVWFADVAATLCAIGDVSGVEEDGQNFPLAIDLHTVLIGNERDGTLTATAKPVRRGRKLSVIRTRVTGQSGRTLIEMTSTHLRAEKQAGPPPDIQSDDGR